MTTLPFGADITLASVPTPITATTPTVTGVIGLAGAGAQGATTNQLHLVHSLSEMVALVGTDGELHKWAQEFYTRESGQVLVGIIAAYTANDDSDRETKADAALDLFQAGHGPTGLVASLIDIHDYGTNVESGSETDASHIVAKLETVCENIKALGFANYPAAESAALSAWATSAATWATNNRKARVMCCVGTVLTAANADGIPASSVLVDKRAALDGSDGISEPLGNKAVTGIVGTYPTIPYNLDRSATLVGRTLQNTAASSVSFLANYRGWKTVRGVLASDNNRKYESILRAVDVAEARYRGAVGDHLDRRNGVVRVALLEASLSNVTAALVADSVIGDANFTVSVQPDENAEFKIVLSGAVTTIKPLVQVDLNIEVT